LDPTTLFGGRKEKEGVFSHGRGVDRGRTEGQTIGNVRQKERVRWGTIYIVLEGGGDDKLGIVLE